MEKSVYTIVIKETAEEELWEEYEYYVLNYSLRYAEKFRLRFYQKVKSILPFPFLYSECRFLSSKHKIYRNIVWGNYLIVYKVTKRQVLVLGLFHTKQNPQKLKSYKRVK